MGEIMTEYDLCYQCQGSGQCHVQSPTVGLPIAVQLIGGFYSCSLCNGTGRILNATLFIEQIQEYLNDNADLLEAAMLAKETLKKS